MELHISLEGRHNLTGEIYRQLLHAIRDGRLRGGERLPPTRELANRLGVARMTVSLAYERLTGEGLLAPRVGAGTFVSEAVPRLKEHADPSTGPLRARRVWDGVPTALVRRLFARPAEFDFRTGIPDVSLFPMATWRRLTSREWTAPAQRFGVYGDPAGHDGLRRAIVRHVGMSRGVSARADDVIVTSGTQQALDLLARALLGPGEGVAVEDPGYPPAFWLFKALGARVTGVPVDREGIVVDALPRNVRLMYVTPSHQFPLGMTMSLSRRVALLSWARRNNAAIIEDDYDSEFRFGGRPIETLQSMDTTGRVIYVGSFSKSLLPSLRLGFIVTPPSLTNALCAVKYVTDWHTPLPFQAVLSHFIDEGGFARHVRKMRGIYQLRHSRIVDFVERELADLLEVMPSAVGLHVCAMARHASPAQIDGVVRRASASGVAVDPLAKYALGARGQAGLLIGYGAIATNRIEEGLRVLRRSFSTEPTHRDFPPK